MSDSGSESTAEEEKEEELYQWMYDIYTNDLEEKFPYCPEHSPVRPTIYSESETHAAAPAERVGTHVSENTTRRKQNYLFFKRKPWRRPGAKISDYFNYGFDEETWSAYCKKQTELQIFRCNLAKITAQGMTEGYEDEPCCSHFTAGRPSSPASREPNTGIDVSGGQDGCSSAAEGHACLSDGANNTQVVTEMSHKEDSTTADDLMPLSVINKSLTAFFPPPSSLFKSECPAPSFSAVLGSEHCQDFDGPSTSYQRLPASNPPVIDATKAWESFLSHGNYDKDKNRSRASDCDKKKKRCRDRKKKKKSSSSSHNSDKKQKKWRKSTEHKHCSAASATRRMTEKTKTEDTNASRRKKKTKRDTERN